MNPANGEFLAPFDTSPGIEVNAALPVPAGTASKLLVHLPAVLGAGESVTLTVRKNSVDTGITCTVVATTSSCADTVHSAGFADGDLLTVRYNESSNINPRVKFSILYQAP